MAYKTTVATEPYGQRYFGNLLLERALPNLAHEQFGDQKPLPKKNSKTTTFRRFASFDPATIAATEGTTPDPSDYIVTQITASVDQYIRTAGITDMVDFTKPDAHLTELTEMLGENMGNTKDIIVRNAVVPNAANTYFADGAATIAGLNVGATTATITATQLDLIHRNMRNSDAAYFTRIVRPGKAISSYPVGASYWGVVHPNIAYTIRDMTGFIAVEEYAKEQQMAIGEFGKYKNFRFVETTNGYVNAGAAAAAADAYYTAFFAPHAFGVVPLSGMDGELYFKDFGSGDDVARQRATVAWKGCWTAAILNDAFMSVLSNISE